MKGDAALDALLLPFAQRQLQAASRILFLRAREGAALHALGLRNRLACVQPFKPWADALERAGFDVAAEASADTRHPQVLVLPTRQREEARLDAAALELDVTGVTPVQRNQNLGCGNHVVALLYQRAPCGGCGSADAAPLSEPVSTPGWPRYLHRGQKYQTRRL